MGDEESENEERKKYRSSVNLNAISFIFCCFVIYYHEWRIYDSMYMAKTALKRRMYAQDIE